MRRIAFGGMLAFGTALANPVGPQVTAGQATLQSAGKTLTVTNAPGTIVNWQGFSIGAGELTRFQQQSSMSAVLNRVTGRDPSSILGQLSSNGRVFLINPHGVVFGHGAVINTAGFVASTLNMADRDFLEGRYKFEGGGNGLLRNEGTIRAGGDIFLIGPQVENAGLIRSDSGSVVLAAGRSVTITSPDAHGVQFELQAPSDRAVNLGTIEAHNAVGMFAGSLRHSGDIRAVSASVDAAGRVTLSALADATVDGSATVFARGAAGGGEIHVTGTSVRLGENTTLDASAAVRGDGGKVIVFAHDDAQAHGAIAVRGGPQGGDGGFVETSGRRTLDFSRAPDITAPAGRAGRWLIDPSDITIDAANEPAIESALNAGGTVTLATSGAGVGAGDIHINVQLDKTAGPDATLELQAHNNVNINNGIVSTSNRLNLALLPDLDGDNAGAVNWFGGGNFSIALNGGLMTLPAGKVLNINAVGFRGLDNLTFDNFGTVNYTSGGFFGWSLSLNNGAVLNNAGTFRLLNPSPGFANQGNQGIESFGGTSTFNNTGTLQNAYPAGGPSYLFRSSGGALAFQNNGGTIDAGGATLDVQIGGSHSGAMTVNNGVLAFTLGAHGFVAGSSIGGSGVLRLNGATTSFADTAVNSTLNLNSGTVNLNGTLAFAPGSMLDWSNGAAMVGPGRIHVASGATANIVGSNGGAILSNVVFDNAGTVNYTSGGLFGWSLHLDNATQFNNAGVFNYAAGGQGIESFGGAATFNNTGMLRNAHPIGGPGFAFRSQGGALSFLNNGGTIDPGGEALDVQVGGSHAGTMTIANGALTFSNGTHTFNGANFGGAGALNVNGAALVLDNTTYDKSINLVAGSVSIPTTATIPAAAAVEINHAIGGAGTLINQGTLNVATGDATLSGSLVAQSGTITVQAGRTLTVGGAGLDWRGGTLAGIGTYDLSELTFFGGGARALNGPTFNVPNFSMVGGSLDVQAGALNLSGASVIPATTSLTLSGGAFTSTGTLSNQGVFTKNTGATTTIAGPFTNGGIVNVNAGMVDFAGGYTQTANSLVLAGGNVAAAAGFFLQGGEVRGNGSITANVNNNGGVVRAGVSPGTLAVNGNYTQAAGGALEVELGGMTQGITYDLLQVTGTAILAGTLNVTLFGGFAGAPGNTFDVITYGSRIGNFTAVNFPAGTTMTATPHPALYQLSLNAVAAPPPAAPASPAIAIDTSIRQRPASDLTSLFDSTQRTRDERGDQEDGAAAGAGRSRLVCR